MTSGNFICNPCMLLRIKFVWPMTRAYFYFIFSQQNRHLIRKIKFYVCIIIHKPLHCCVSHYYVLKMEKCVYGWLQLLRKYLSQKAKINIFLKKKVSSIHRWDGSLLKKKISKYVDFFFAFVEEEKQFNNVLKLKFIFPDFNPAFYYT